MTQSGKVALITGADSGIGRATAALFAREGADVAILYLCEHDDAAKTKEIVEKEGRKAITIAGDVGDKDFCERAVRQTVEQLGRLDILVNNAGTNIRKPAQELSTAEWKEVVDTNLTSAFVACQAAYPPMKQAGGGKIINIGSMLSIFGAGFAPAYGASKGGIVQLSKALASGWAKDNIQVNAVLPGWIDTDLTRNARREVTGLHENILRRTPDGRWGGIDDMAGVAVFLASPASDFVTGAVIPVDGGYSIQG